MRIVTLKGGTVNGNVKHVDNGMLESLVLK